MRLIRAELVLLVLVIACRVEDQQSLASHPDSSSTQRIENGGQDRPLAMRQQIVRILRGDSLALVSSADEIRLASDASGTLYILDPGSQRVLRLDSLAGPIDVWGGKGGGPGELQYPASLSVDISGTLAVLDGGKMAIQRFSSDATPLDPVPFSSLVSGFGSLSYTNMGAVIERRRVTGESWQRQLLFATGLDTTLLMESEPEALHPVAYPGCHIVATPASPVFAPQLHWIATHSGVAIARGPEYEVRLYHGPHLSRVVRRSITPRPATRKLALLVLGQGHTFHMGRYGDCVVSAAEMLEKAGMADVIPLINGLYLDRDRSLWVEREVIPGEPRLIDLFDTAGMYMGTLTGDHLFPQATGPSGTLAAVRSDSLGVADVVLFRMQGD
jgi:hypothetical protein